jgi:CheY-like chemotaxis protein
MASTTILIIDDSASLAGNVSMALRIAGTGHVVAAAGRRHVEELETEDVDLIIVDVTMSGTDPFRAIAELRRRAPAIPIIAAGAHGIGQPLSPPGRLAPAGAAAFDQSRRALVTATRIVTDGKTAIPS